MQVLKIYPGSINERHITEAVETLRAGGIIIYPTDTYYALGCNALNNSAVEQICRLKGVDPAKRCLSIVCKDMSQASDYVKIDNRAFRILRDNLPGPFTFILPASTRLPKVFKGRRVVGLRIPDNAIARRLAEELDGPLLSGTVPGEIADAEETALECDRFARLMIDGGTLPCEGSTIVDLTDSEDPVVTRQGRGELR